MFWRRSCCRRRCCRCNCCGCRGCSNNLSSTEPQIETVCYCSRYIDIPMTTIYGEGYTELDCCIDTKSILQEISDTLKELV
ncbi:MAG: hypothetical protein VB078_08665 [Clostridiaceae bacterium]|nr:hypothetical protein [Clostridiaceae bacterium]